MDLWGVLNQQLQEHTLALLFASSLTSAVLGASAKALIEILLPQALKERRDARRLVARLSPTMADSAAQLGGRIHNFVTHGRNRWMAESAYYRLGSYYSVAQYFGWVHILEHRSV